MQGLLKQAKGGRKERLQEVMNGGAQAEKLFMLAVWWPAIGSFADLEAEYEVHDAKDGPRYLDFACFRGAAKLVVEIDGYGPHWRDAGRRSFGDQLMRQNDLVLDGWTVLRFSYHDVLERPRQCQQVLLRYFGRMSLTQYSGGSEDRLPLKIQQAGLVKLAKERGLLNAGIVVDVFRIPRRNAAYQLMKLHRIGVLEPVLGERRRIKDYRLTALYRD